MNEGFNHLLAVFFGYFAIMNPLANTAVFVGLTGDLDDGARRVVARRSLLITFAIVFVFAALGKTLFHFFGVTLPALRIAGAILVFVIGYHMLHGETSSLHDHGKASADDMAISPLAVPLLAGPGTIATTMSFAAAGDWLSIAITVAVFALMCLMTYLCFVFGESVLARVGAGGLKIVTRLMGLILAVIGVQMGIEGVAGALPLLRAG
ncbi:MAG: MarC family protein [Zoogloeaceae bacterium]|nr:MarC family protein [Rhodocyclaceae bacterium]MCP5236938.1 MarC family protein [Zoogloeaceae bacterium]